MREIFNTLKQAQSFRSKSEGEVGYKFGSYVIYDTETNEKVFDVDEMVNAIVAKEAEHLNRKDFWYEDKKNKVWWRTIESYAFGEYMLMKTIANPKGDPNRKPRLLVCCTMMDFDAEYTPYDQAVKEFNEHLLRFTPRPPIGAKPRWLWLEERKKELHDAINRYVQHCMTPPKEWYSEIVDITLEQNNLKK